MQQTKEMSFFCCITELDQVSPNLANVKEAENGSEVLLEISKLKVRWIIIAGMQLLG